MVSDATNTFNVKPLEFMRVIVHGKLSKTNKMEMAFSCLWKVISYLKLISLNHEINRMEKHLI